MTNTESTLTKHQTKTFGPKPISGWGKNALIKAEVRFDDECGNGHNSFAITGEIYIPGHRHCEACGCLHDEIAKCFPELAPFIKWHLSSTDGPMHYVANTLYWLGYDVKWYDGKPNYLPNLAHARSTAVWPDMPEEFLARNPNNRMKCGKFTRDEIVTVLHARQDALLAEFKTAVESLGFTW